MALATIAQIRLEANLPDTVLDKILTPHLTKATIEIKKIITPAVYTEIAALEATDDDFITCSMAEANLAFSYAIPSLNIETQGSGIVQSKGWDESRSQLLSQSEIEKLQEYYRSIAMDLLKPYIPQEEITTTNESLPDEVRGADFRLSAL
jgi:hypothetical protein